MKKAFEVASNVFLMGGWAVVVGILVGSIVAGVAC
jgi:hypothetical protein